jgi:hypothetical protein
MEILVLGDISKVSLDGKDICRLRRKNSKRRDEKTFQLLIKSINIKQSDRSELFFFEVCCINPGREELARHMCHVL